MEQWWWEQFSPVGEGSHCWVARLYNIGSFEKKKKEKKKCVWGRVGEGKNELCPEYQGTRGSEVDDQRILEENGEKTAFRNPGRATALPHCHPSLPRRNTISQQIPESCFQNSHPLIDCEIKFSGLWLAFIRKQVENNRVLHIIRLSIVSVPVCVYSVAMQNVPLPMVRKKAHKASAREQLSLQIFGINQLFHWVSCHSLHFWLLYASH